MVEARWLILIVLFAARFALGYQFQAAGSVASFLIQDLQVDYVQIGALVGLFMLPGVVVAVPSARLSQRYGDKNVVLAGMALMLVGGVLSGVAESFAMVVISRVISGIGGAVLLVLMSKMVIDWFADRELFLGMAIFIVGWPVGIAAAQATQGLIAETQSWHVVFISTAVLVAISLLLMLAFYRPPGTDRPAQEQRHRLTPWESGMMCVAGVIWMFLNGAYLVMLSFGPSLLTELGMPVVEAGFVVSVISWVFIFGLPVGGWLATRYAVPNLVMIGGLAGSVVAGALIPFSGNPLLTFALFGIALALATPVIGALPAEILAPGVRGQGFGVYYLWYFGGMPVLMAIAGILRDRTGTTTASLIFATSMVLACLLLVAVFRLAQDRRNGALEAGASDA